MLKQFIELVKKDLLTFAADRKAMLITFAVPIAIASFLGAMFGSVSSGTQVQKIKILVVDQDRSAITKGIVDKLRASSSVEPKVVDEATAVKETRDGTIGSAFVFAKGFGAKASAAMDGGAKPDVPVLLDPSKSMEAQVAKGSVIRYAMQAVAEDKFGASAATDSLPFNFTDKPQTSAQATNWSGSAHAFAGMGVQALFFGAIEAAMGMLRDRRNGLWSRLRASPVSPWTLLAARFTGATAVSFLIFLGVFAFGALAFGYRITGSYLGFLLVAIAVAAMAAGLGLFIAALGRTEQQSRGLSVLVVLSLLMLGGAWMPAFIMPPIIQTISLFTPVRWAVDGIDNMTFRGLGLTQALPSVGVLLLFALVLAIVAGKRFRWEPETA